MSVVVPVVETGTWNAEAEFILKDTDANDFLFIKVCIMNRKLLPVIGGREDGMMLAVLAGMLTAGVILLGLPAVLKRNRPREK